MGGEFLWDVVQSAFQSEMGDLPRRHIDCRTDWWRWVMDNEAEDTQQGER